MAASAGTAFTCATIAHNVIASAGGTLDQTVVTCVFGRLPFLRLVVLTKVSSFGQPSWTYNGLLFHNLIMEELPTNRPESRSTVFWVREPCHIVYSDLCGNIWQTLGA